MNMPSHTPMNVSIYDMLGKFIATFNTGLTTGYEIDLKNGMYFVQTGTDQVRKVFVNR